MALAIFLVVLALLVGGGVLFGIYRLLSRLPSDDHGGDSGGG